MHAEEQLGLVRDLLMKDADSIGTHSNLLWIAEIAEPLRGSKLGP